MQHRRRAAPAFVVLGLAACTAACTAAKAPPPAPARGNPSSYDWRSLLTVPFGTTVKAVPFALHEVLLFKDAAASKSAEQDECYAPDPPAPRFLDRRPDQYLMCFKNDRLARIEAALILPSAAAARILSDACASWGTPADPAQRCQGGEGQGSQRAVAFSAQLEGHGPGVSASGAAGEATTALVIALSGEAP